MPQPSWMRGVDTLNATDDGYTGSYRDPETGRLYMRIEARGNTPVRYRGYDALSGQSEASDYNGTGYTEYDENGNPISDGTWQNLSGYKDDLRDIATAMAIVGGWGALGAGVAGASASGAGAGAGVGESVSGTYLSGAESAALGGGGAGGPSFATGFTDGGTAGGALDTAYAGGAGGVGPNFSQGFTDGGTAGGALDTAYTGATAGIPYTGSPSPSLLNPPASAAPAAATTAATTAAGGASGLGSLLGPIATVVGAVAGGQGQQTENSSQRRMDPRLDEAVFGPQGVVPRTQTLLNDQMAPGAMPGWAQMRQQGQTLMNSPIAGNGYSSFAGRRL